MPKSLPPEPRGLPPMPVDLIRSENECQYKHFTAKVGEPINPDAAIDIECFMSTDSVDSDDEVMLPDGIDLSRYEKNPVVMLCHAMGQPGCFYPLPVGKALWTRRAKHGVLAGVRFARDTEMGRQVKSLFDEGMLRSFSVGFRPLEASAMTRKEAESRADWKAAYDRTKGQVRVFRKWHLVELSVAPIPSNPDALVTNYKAKGILVPEWLKSSLSDGTTMSESVESPEMEETETKAVKPVEAEPCECGKADCKCSEVAKDIEEEPASDEVEPDAKDMAEASGEASDDAEDPDEVEAEEEEDDDEPEEIGPLKRYDHASIKSPHYKGFGRVESLHTKGHVPHASNHMMGSKEDPAACIKCYRKMGDGYTPTDDHVAVKVAHLTKLGTPMNPPSKKSAPAPVAKTVRTEPLVEPLPPLVAKSDQQLQKELAEQIKSIPQLVNDAIAKYVGVV